jgi:hypothetical protein
MDRSDRQNRLARFLVLLVLQVEVLKNSMVRAFLIPRHGVVIFVVDPIDVDGDVVVVEQIDDLGVGERTRSDGSGAPSATLQGDGVLALGATAVREQEHGTPVVLGQAQGVAEVLGPGNVIQEPFLMGWLPGLNPLIDLGDQVSVRGLVLSSRFRQRDDPSQAEGQEQPVSQLFHPHGYHL